MYIYDNVVEYIHLSDRLSLVRKNELRPFTYQHAWTTKREREIVRVSVTETANSRLSMGKLSRLWIAAKLVKTAILRVCIQRDV